MLLLLELAPVELRDHHRAVPDVLLDLAPEQRLLRDVIIKIFKIFEDIIIIINTCEMLSNTVTMGSTPFSLGPSYLPGT